MKVPFLIIVPIVVLSTSAAAAGCPNWSSKFDGVQNPEVRAKLRSTTNWDDLIAQSGGPNAVLVQAKGILVDARERLATAQEAARRLAATDAGARSSVTWSECSGNLNALMAAKCEALNMNEVIMVTEGQLELVQCRTR